VGEIGTGWVAEPMAVQDVAPPHVLQLQDGRLGMVTSTAQADGLVTITAIHGDNAPWTWGPLEPTRLVHVLVRRDVLAGQVIHDG